jgi:hypothetical protein
LGEFRTRIRIALTLSIAVQSSSKIAIDSETVIAKGDFGQGT